MQYEFLLIECCKVSLLLNDHSYFLFFKGLYDVAYFRKDDFFFFNAKEAESKKEWQNARDYAQKALSVNSRHFGALTVLCELGFEHPELTNENELNFNLELLMKINSHPLVHGLISRLHMGKNLEKSIYHSQVAISSYFETAPFDVELLSYGK